MRTRKIKDFKDFMECLRAGKKVKDIYDSTYTFEYGMICETSMSGTFYGIMVYDAKLKNMTVEEPELKIEVGKLYKTRDGRKAIVGIKYYNERKYLVSIEGELNYIWVDEEGRFDSPRKSRFDLVAEWED